MKSRTEILVPLAAIQAVPIAVIAWYRLHRYAWYRYSAIVRIDSDTLRENAQPMLKNDYGKYLLSILEENEASLTKNLEY